MNFVVRNAVLGDIENIYKLGKKIEELRFSKEMQFHDKEELAEFISKKSENILIVSTHSKKIIGFLYARIVSHSWCILDNIAIDNEYRKHGIGKDLLERLYEILKSRRINYIQILEDEKNKRLRRFWKEQGFVERKRFVWADKAI